MIMSMEERENYIKSTVTHFRKEIEEKGFIKYEDIKAKCTFNGEINTGV